MTDTELLDALQRILTRRVAVLRTCRSGVKLMVSDTGFRFADPLIVAIGERDDSGQRIREYFGTGLGLDSHPEMENEFGPDVRGALRKAIEAGEDPR